MAYIKKKVNFIWSIYDRGENRWSIYKRDNPTPNTLNTPQKKIPLPYPMFSHFGNKFHIGYIFLFDSVYSFWDVSFVLGLCPILGITTSPILPFPF
jgi:hypothetical protein